MKNLKTVTKNLLFNSTGFVFAAILSLIRSEYLIAVIATFFAVLFSLVYMRIASYSSFYESGIIENN